jgi:hypothetical protein
VLIEELPIVAHKTGDCTWRQDGPPVSEDQMKTDAEVGAGHSFGKLRRDPGLADHGGRAGDNASTV